MIGFFIEGFIVLYAIIGLIVFAVWLLIIKTRSAKKMVAVKDIWFGLVIGSCWFLLLIILLAVIVLFFIDLFGGKINFRIPDVLGIAKRNWNAFINKKVF